MGAAGENDILPVEIGLLVIQEEAPFSLWVLFGEVFYELKYTLFDGVGLGNGDFIGVIFASGGFEADVASAMF